jgi:hypothetical protein
MPTVIGELTDKATKEGINGQYVELRVLPQGRDYPVTVRDFDDLVNTSDFKKGDTVEVEFSERVGNYRGREVTYRNLVSIRHVDVPTELFPMEMTAPEAEREDGQSTPPAQPEQQRTERATARAQSAPFGGATTSGWREAYTQSREASETQRASIEAQTALKEAWEAVREFIRQDKVKPDDSARIRRLLTDYTVIGLSAMREASRLLNKHGGDGQQQD